MICYRQGWDLKALTFDRLKVRMLVLTYIRNIWPNAYLTLSYIVVAKTIQVFSKIAIPVASNSLVSNLANSMVTLIAARMGSDVVCQFP